MAATTAARPVTTDDMLGALQRLAAGMGAGLLCGLIIGGVGGRLAMFVLRVTSSSKVIGLETDDGFIVGKFTFDTFFLLAVTAAVGAFGGAVYIGLRRWLPPRARPGLGAIALAVVVGAVIVEPGGVDFTVLRPLWLAVAMFIALPGLFGAALAWSADHLAARYDRLGRPAARRLLLRLLPLAAIAPAAPGAVPIIATGVGWYAVRHWPALGRLWWSAPITLAGRIVLVAIVARAAYGLAGNVADIL